MSLNRIETWKIHTSDSLSCVFFSPTVFFRSSGRFRYNTSKFTTKTFVSLSLVLKPQTPRRRGPRHVGGHKRYRMVKFVVCYFGLYSVLSTDGSILRHLGSDFASNYIGALWLSSRRAPPHPTGCLHLCLIFIIPFWFIDYYPTV